MPAEDAIGLLLKRLRQVRLESGIQATDKGILCLGMEILPER
ncbi:hypothetical protein Tph_c20960 [Thermacetogenium phaeum DSM 12270]|jgi:hypothetical protein|uniref:Uncharacterized protein n=2 Tax=Thermacetogenium phaeum TaxID=85874 RepID=K4LK36_THEPS|nr:hypothetical protein [Thermacetogenium phaeum]AFV12290.1 hypothetical protein Tph_c20960 [Thermacetogenium phaeum DSM 12270]KUK35806.1 MAG: Uncharacterized protein XD66_1489 [Thermacetogenium phaeum]